MSATRAHKAGKAAGSVILVGGGPGDPGLVTIKGARALAAAQAVVYDRLASPALVDLTPAGCERHDVGKLVGDGGRQQRAINALLVRLARRGLRVVRLKGGDPFAFARGGEEMMALKAAGVSASAVPGVTSGLAALAAAGIPLTHRGVADCAVLATGRTREGLPAGAREAAMARLGATLVYYMGVENAAALAEGLMAGGLPASTPAAAVRRGTWADQRVVATTLGRMARDLAKAGLAAPAILVVGGVVALRGRMGQPKPGPLVGRGVLVTRAEGQVGRLSALLAEAGARVIEVPLIRFEPMDPAGTVRRALDAARPGDWVAFTSANGVRFFMDGLSALGRDSRALGGLRLAAVGPGTAAALAGHGLRPDLVPRRADAEGLLRELAPRTSGSHVFLARPKRGREEILEGLRRRGVAVTPLVLYSTLPAKARGAAARAMEADVALFASASAVESFRQAFTAAQWRRLGRVPAVAIGPSTAKAIRTAGLKLAARATAPTLEALVGAAARCLAQ